MFCAVPRDSSGDDFSALADVFSELLNIFIVYMLLFLDAVIAEFRSAS